MDPVIELLMKQYNVSREDAQRMLARPEVKAKAAHPAPAASDPWRYTSMPIETDPRNALRADPWFDLNVAEAKAAGMRARSESEDQRRAMYKSPEKLAKDEAEHQQRIADFAKAHPEVVRAREERQRLQRGNIIARNPAAFMSDVYAGYKPSVVYTSLPQGNRETDYDNHPRPRSSLTTDDLLALTGYKK